MVKTVGVNVGKTTKNPMFSFTLQSGNGRALFLVDRVNM